MQVQTHCRNLSGLQLIDSYPKQRGNPVDLLGSYCTNFKEAALPEMTLEQYQTVANGCPAADISIGCKWHRVADATAGLGDRLTKLHVAFGAASDLAALRMGAAACPRLREIKWVTFGRDKSEMETFLLVQHPELHSLVVSSEDESGVLSVLAGVGLLVHRHTLSGNISRARALKPVFEEGLYRFQAEIVRGNEGDVCGRSSIVRCVQGVAGSLSARTPDRAPVG